MKHTLIAVAAAAAMAVPVAAATADEPDIPATPAQIVAYHDSGEWDDDITAVTDKARTSLASQLRKKPRKPAIVFDIDDTLESTYECAKKSDFDRGAITVCIVQGDQDPIKQTKSLYRYALKKKVAVYFVTGRPEGIRTATEQQLERDGFTKGTLLMAPNSDFSQGSASKPKIAHRKAIEKRGFKILVNIGDQKSDLSGGYSVKRYKLPNPMYFTQ